MNAALKGTPDEDFSPYEPMGTAAYANSGGGSGYDGSTTATPSPDSNNGDNNNGDKKKKKKHDNSDNAFLIPPSDLPTFGRAQPAVVG